MYAVGRHEIYTALVEDTFDQDLRSGVDIRGHMSDTTLREETPALTATAGPSSSTIFDAGRHEIHTVMSADSLLRSRCERASPEKDQSPSMSANGEAIESSAPARSNDQQVQCFGWRMCLVEGTWEQDLCSYLEETDTEDATGPEDKRSYFDSNNEVDDDVETLATLQTLQRLRNLLLCAQSTSSKDTRQRHQPVATTPVIAKNYAPAITTDFSTDFTTGRIYRSDIVQPQAQVQQTCRPKSFDEMLVNARLLHVGVNAPRALKPHSDY